MKRGALLLVLGALLAAPATWAQAPAPAAQAPAGFAVGTTVPADITLTDLEGKTHRLGDYRGKVVFIHFWSIVCPYEKQAEPKAIELQKAYGDKGVVQIAINSNKGELAEGPPFAKLKEHLQQASVNFIVTVDPGNAVADQFGGRTTPHCFVIDKDGVVQYNGALDDDPRGTKGDQATPYVKNAIEAVLAGKPVETATTKPYG